MAPEVAVEFAAAETAIENLIVSSIGRRGEYGRVQQLQCVTTSLDWFGLLSA